MRCSYLSKRGRRLGSGLVLLALGLAPAHLRAADSRPMPDEATIESQESVTADKDSDQGEEVESRNELALVLAGTYETQEEANYFTVGAEYEYRFHPLAGWSGAVEYVTDVGSWVFVFPVVLHPAGGLKILAGPGLEHKSRRRSESSEDDEDSGNAENLFLFRIGVNYAFEFGGWYSIVPALELDFVNEDDGVAKALVYGMNFGISF